MPDLVTNGYYLLGYDWRETAEEWKERGSATPPVMITVANRTETAARIKHAFDSKRVRIDELCDPERTLHIDSKVLAAAEAAEEPIAEIGTEDAGTDQPNGPGRKLTKKQRAELLRRQVDTVGRPGRPGERVQNVISVGMLSEGWDAKTVTHIMGLRAFTSQLLCEQVVGRGLRRTSYEVNPETGLFDAGSTSTSSACPSHSCPTRVARTALRLHRHPRPPSSRSRTRRRTSRSPGPTSCGVDYAYRPRLSLDLDRVEPLYLDAAWTAQLAELAPTIDGKPDITKIDSISLEDLAREFRTQKIVFETARDVYDQMEANWPGDRIFLLAQLVRLVERFMGSGRIKSSCRSLVSGPTISSGGSSSR